MSALAALYGYFAFAVFIYHDSEIVSAAFLLCKHHVKYSFAAFGTPYLFGILKIYRRI